MFALLRATSIRGTSALRGTALATERALIPARFFRQGARARGAFNRADVSRTEVSMVSNTYFRSFNAFNLRNVTLLGLAATSAALAAHCYSILTHKSILDQVVVDKRGDLYLSAAGEELFYDDKSKRVLSYYEYMRSLVTHDDVHTVKMTYLILFPVIKNAEGQLTVDYDNPACASQSNAYKKLGMNNMTYLATREDLEGRGLGRVMLVNAAERSIDKGRDFSGDPIGSAVSFYIHVLNRIQSVIGAKQGDGDIFDIKSYEQNPDSEHQIIVPLYALITLINIYKLGEELRNKPRARRQHLDEHPELIKLHAELQSKLGDKAWSLHTQHIVNETLFSRITDAEGTSSEAAIEEIVSPSP